MTLPASTVDGIVRGWFEHLGQALLRRHAAQPDVPYVHRQGLLRRERRQMDAVTADDSIVNMNMIGHRAAAAALGLDLTPRLVNWPDTLPLEAVLERLEFLHRFHQDALATPIRPTEDGPDPWAANQPVVVEAFATLVRQEGFSHAEADIKHLAAYLESAFPVALALWSAVFRIYRHIRVVAILIRPNKSIGWSVFLDHVENELHKQHLLSDDWFARKDYIHGAHHDSAPQHAEQVFSRIESMPLHQPISLQPSACLTDFLKLVPPHLVDPKHDLVAQVSFHHDPCCAAKT
ncbi:hypothetical protein Rhopal_001270-T1 [Rhodotorula paludigena]|uniref:Uncharacterized protein n=1 Tax=Rhodotorula paludigena TaxID=86838 RepID=A0AAV5GF78_9BASI|nr:hypothetical protein Rhopal_001270-T1 [Rhodotorula paludigena]